MRARRCGLGARARDALIFLSAPTFSCPTHVLATNPSNSIRYKIERKYAKHTTFKSCTARGNHSPTAPVRSVVIAISKAGVRLPEIVFKQAQVALDGSFPAKAVGRIMDMLNEYQNYAELAPRAAKLAQEMRAVYQLAA